MNGLLTVAGQPLEDCPARRIGKCFENVIGYDRHAETIAKWLLVVKVHFCVYARTEAHTLRNRQLSHCVPGRGIILQSSGENLPFQMRGLAVISRKNA
jgi:phosphoribosylaminoimidazole carboxylase (NCAIR synthetase)